MYVLYLATKAKMQEVSKVSEIEKLFDTVPRKTRKEEARIKNFFLRA